MVSSRLSMHILGHIFPKRQGHSFLEAAATQTGAQPQVATGATLTCERGTLARIGLSIISCSYNRNGSWRCA